MRPEDLLGKTVLVGLTYVSARGEVRERRGVHGVIESADESGIAIREPSGELFTLPPAVDAFEPAEPGEYRLQSTGEVVPDPDLLCSWTIAAAPSTIDDWVDAYEERRELHETFAEQLRTLLEQLLTELGLEFAWLITFESSAYEIHDGLLWAWRDRRPAGDPLDGGLRAIGVTVCLLTPSDAQELEELLEAEFAVHPAASVTWGACARDADAITYELPSYLVELDERRASLAEWAPFAGLKLRIEAVTELSDGWRHTLDHLPLRRAASYPDELREILVRRAAAIDEADRDIALVHDSLAGLLEGFRASIASGDLELPVDAVTLRAYLDGSEVVESLVELGVELGFRHDDDPPGWHEVEDRALWLLQRDSVESLADLDAFLQNVLPRTRETLARLLELSQEAGLTPWASRGDLVTWLWLVFHRADGETVALLDYRDELTDALDTLIGNPASARSEDA